MRHRHIWQPTYQTKRCGKEQMKTLMACKRDGCKEFRYFVLGKIESHTIQEIIKLKVLELSEPKGE